MKAEPKLARNPGPQWGFRFLQGVQRVPWPLIRPLFMLGTWIAVVAMPGQRRYSRAYLTHLFGRPARMHEVWRHFYSYMEFLLLRLRVAGGAPASCVLAPEKAAEFEALMHSGEPALFGTFHFGHSDLLGFLLSGRGRRVAMIRLRVTNTEDTEMLERQFEGAVSFIWVNEPENLLFAVKGAIERGDSLAMQCDRLYASKAEPFDFLGARRLFPFTIYHLAVLFQRPVIFCVGVPDGAGGTRVHSSTLFRAEPGASRAGNLERARRHFQQVLAGLETLVRQHPMLWFNFIPLNPEVGRNSPSAR